MNKNNGTRTYPFNKGIAFVVLKENDTIKKIDKQLRKFAIIHFDPMQKVTNKMQRYISYLKKTSLPIRNISTYVLRTQFHQDYMVHLKPINLKKKLSHVNYCLTVGAPLD